MPALPPEHTETTNLLSYLLEMAGPDATKLVHRVILKLADEVCNAAFEEHSEAMHKHGISEEHMEKVYADPKCKLFDALPDDVQMTDAGVSNAIELHDWAMEINGLEPRCSFCNWKLGMIVRSTNEALQKIEEPTDEAVLAYFHSMNPDKELVHKHDAKSEEAPAEAAE
jgi:hypothetical protein